MRPAPCLALAATAVACLLPLAAVTAAAPDAPAPTGVTPPAETPAPAEQAPGTEASGEAEEKRICRYVKLETASRRKTKVCRTVEEWRELNNPR